MPKMHENNQLYGHRWDSIEKTELSCNYNSFNLDDCCELFHENLQADTFSVQLCYTGHLQPTRIYSASFISCDHLKDLVNGFYEDIVLKYARWEWLERHK